MKVKVAESQEIKFNQKNNSELFEKMKFDS